MNNLTENRKSFEDRFKNDNFFNDFSKENGLKLLRNDNYIVFQVNTVSKDEILANNILKKLNILIENTRFNKFRKERRVLNGEYSYIFEARNSYL
tara:strand:+ start:170 stop:454 length:285 start_codon:yes stop_codon:yes gene_type:complete